MGYIFFFFLSFVSGVQENDIDFIAYVEEKVITNKDNFYLTLEFSWKGKPQDYQIELPSKLNLSGIEVLGSGASNKLLDQNGVFVTKRVVKYRLKAIRTGKVEINSITAYATAVESGTVKKLESLPLSLNVTKYIEPYKLESKLLWIILVSFLLLLILIYLVVSLSKRKKKKLMELQNDIVITLEDEIIKEMKQFKNDVNTVEDEFRIFSRLYDHYLKDKKVEKSGIFFGEKDVNFSLSQFKNDMEMYRFSGQSPDIYQFDEFIKQFLTILENNKKFRKDMEI